MKTRVTVIYPITVSVDFDSSKENDDDYVEDKRNEAKRLAAKILATESKTLPPVIHDSSTDALIE